MINKKTKEHILLLCRFGLSAVLLVYLFSKMDIAKMRDVLRHADYGYLWICAGIFVVLNFLLLMRWKLFVRAMGLSVSLKRVAECFFIGLFFNLFLPTSTGGDVVKTIGMFQDTTERAKVVASVVCDRLSGFISITLVATVSFIFGHRLISDNSVLLSIVVLGGLSLMTVLFLFNETLYSFCCRVFNRLPHIKEKFMKLHYAIALLKEHIHYMFFAILLSCTSQTMLVLSFYFVSKALGQNISIVYFFVFVPIVCVAASLPSIGGLGARDAGAAYYFAKAGMATATAVSMTLINFAFMVAVGLIGGVIYITALTPNARKELKADSPSNE